MKRKRFLAPAILFAFLTAGFSGACYGQQQAEPREVPAEDPEIVVPVGTVIPVLLSSFLNSRSTQVGDTFYADVAYPIWLQQRLIIPKGSTVRGTVTEVVRPGKVKGKARMAIRIDDILLPNGVKRDLMASFRAIHGGGTDKLDRNTETVETDSTKAGDVMTAGSMAATGAMIGSIGGSGTGAGIGAGVGAAVGLATVLFTRGHDLVLEPGTQFELELRQPLKFVYGEVDFSMGQINSARPGPPRAKSNNPSRPRSWMPPFFGIPIPRP